MLTISNNGAKIVDSNYWDSQMAAAGKLYLSMNAGAFRLLAPDSMAQTLAHECGLAKEVVLSFGPWPEVGQKRAAEIILEDNSESPYILHLSEGQIDRWPAEGDDGRRFTFTLWGRGTKLLAELPARFRFTPKIPYMLPWGE